MGTKSLADCMRSVSAALPVLRGHEPARHQDAKRLRDLAKVCADICRDCEAECRKHEFHHVECETQCRGLRRHGQGLERASFEAAAKAATCWRRPLGSADAQSFAMARNSHPIRGRRERLKRMRQLDPLVSFPDLRSLIYSPCCPSDFPGEHQGRPNRGLCREDRVAFAGGCLRDIGPGRGPCRAFSLLFEPTIVGFLRTC